MHTYPRKNREQAKARCSPLRRRSRSRRAIAWMWNCLLRLVSLHRCIAPSSGRGDDVVAGRLGLQFAGEQPRYAGPGETIVLKQGVGHRWWNAGTSSAALHGVGHAAEQPSVLPHGSLRFDEAEWTKTPGFFDAMFSVTGDGSEILMLDIPAVVRKVVSPVLLSAETLLGKYDRLKDAPEPVLKTQIGSPSATRRM